MRLCSRLDDIAVSASAAVGWTRCCASFRGLKGACNWRENMLGNDMVHRSPLNIIVPPESVHWVTLKSCRLSPGT